MRRFANKIDGNQRDIVSALRRVSVQPLTRVGDGVPDLLVGVAGRNLLVEVKRGATAALTQKQERWHAAWRGQRAVVVTVDEVLALLAHSRAVSR